VTGEGSYVENSRKRPTNSSEITADSSNKKLKSLLKECISIVQEQEVHANIEEAAKKETELHIVEGLSKIVESSKKFIKYDENLSTAANNLHKGLINPHTIVKKVLDHFVQTVGKHFIHSVAVFGRCKVFITSIDVFIHSNIEIDDCAYRNTENQYHDTPIAAVNKKETMGNQYYELKIYWGYMELLAVSHSIDNS
jgi:hypothetical protein